MSVERLRAGGSPSNLASIVAEELALLAADAKTLATRLGAGDVVAAVVLGSNGLTDLLEIDGLRVAAELPPTLLPGEVITVMVTGFTGDRINLQIIPTAGEPPQPAAAVPGISAPAEDPADATATTDAPAADSGSSARVVLPQPLPPILGTIEARLATAHVMSPPVPPAPVRAHAAVDTSHPVPPTARPVIATRPASAAPVAVPSPVVPALRGLAAYTDPAALLRALRLPVTATNVASARMALESPEKLPNALVTLARGLANAADPRLATLSTLAGFLERLEPQSPVLATQIAAFVDHVVVGPEAKLADLGAEGPRERVEAVRAALRYDLKTQLLALVASSAAPPATSAALGRAVVGALAAITAVQLNAAAAKSSDPEGLTFALPIALPDGFAQARVRIDREAPDGRKKPLDGDNFHLAFVLETRNLGTVGIDVSTVGRAVTLSVKTEAAPAQRTFGRALGKLGARLETLRYRVAKASAVVAPALIGLPESPTRAPAAKADHLVDIDA